MRLEPHEVRVLPPRLAVEYAKAGGDPAGAVTALAGAEARGLSLREFAGELGTRPPSWLHEGQRPDTAEQVAAMPPERQAEIAREILARPDVAKDVFADPDTAGDAVRGAYAPLAQAMRDHDDRQRDKAVPPGSAEAKTREAEHRSIEVLTVMQRLHEIIIATGKLVSLGELSRDQRELIAPLAQRAKVAVDYLAGLDAGEAASLSDETIAEFLNKNS